MPEFTDPAQAAEALAAANRGELDATASSAQEPANQPTPPDAVRTPEPPQEPTLREPFPKPAEVDSVTDVRYDDLPEDVRTILQEREREMQADYTRKTQELAAQRQEAEQALEFVQSLQTDPEFATQVRDEISNALQQAGLSPQEAQAEANAQVAAAQEPAGEIDSDDPLAQEVLALKQWREQQEERQSALEFENELDRMDARIRQDNPAWTDDDMQDVYALAYAAGGNLLGAAEYYKNMQQRIATTYIDKKESVPASEPTATGPATEPPEKFTGVDDPRLLQAAMRRLNESLPE